MKSLFTILFFILSLSSFADPGQVYHCSSPDSQWKLSAKIIQIGYQTSGFFTAIGPDFESVTGDFNNFWGTSGGGIFGGLTNLKKPFQFEEKLGHYSIQFSRKKIWLDCEIRNQEIAVKNCPVWFCSRGGPISRYEKKVAESHCPREQRPNNCI